MIKYQTKSALNIYSQRKISTCVHIFFGMGYEKSSNVHENFI